MGSKNLGSLGFSADAQTTLGIVSLLVANFWVAVRPCGLQEDFSLRDIGTVNWDLK